MEAGDVLRMALTACPLVAFTDMCIHAPGPPMKEQLVLKILSNSCVTVAGMRADWVA